VRKDKSGPAFPRPASIDASGGTLSNGDRVVGEQDGMTYREWLIGQAMVGELNSYAGLGKADPARVAQDAIEYADAVLARLADEK
jgi:hypothetical protein